MPFDPEQIAKYIVWYAIQRGSSLTTTRVIKFFYLVDLYYARENHGQTLTGWPWAFVHYGPYCSEAFHVLENAASRGIIEKRAYDSRFKLDEEYFLFYCDDEREPPIGQQLPIYVIGQLQRAIAKWGDDTASLLDHVYFDTEPMLDARKGDLLDFTKAKPIKPSKHITLKKLSPEKIALAKKHIKKLGKKLETGMKKLQQENSQVRGLFDDVYFRALEYMEDEDLEQGVEGVAKIVK